MIGRMSSFHALALRHIRKETRQRKLRGICDARKRGLCTERRRLGHLIRQAQQQLLHYRYLSDQLREESRLASLELLYRGEVIRHLALVHGASRRMHVPHPTYEFELLRTVLDASASAWIGTIHYFRYMLVSKYFRDTVSDLCPTDKQRQTDVLHIGDVVSSLQLTGSVAKRCRMHNQLDVNTLHNYHMDKWQRSEVHRFRIIARPVELNSLYTTPERSCKWLLVPDLPWYLLFKLFAISSEVSN